MRTDWLTWLMSRSCRISSLTSSSHCFCDAPQAQPSILRKVLGGLHLVNDSDAHVACLLDVLHKLHSDPRVRPPAAVASCAAEIASTTANKATRPPALRTRIATTLQQATTFDGLNDPAECVNNGTLGPAFLLKNQIHRLKFRSAALVGVNAVHPLASVGCGNMHSAYLCCACALDSRRKHAELSSAHHSL